MDSRISQRLVALALLALSLVFLGAAYASDHPSVPTDRFAGMPEPEGFPMPAGTPTTQSADTTTATLGKPNVRLRRGTYTLHRFGSRGALLGTKKVRLGRARVWRTQADEASFGGRLYAKLTSGPHAGWFVPANAASPAGTTTYNQPISVRIAAGKVVGRRFYGPVVARRPLSLTQATTYSASTRGKFGTNWHYRLVDGPLAGRWVPARKVTVVSSNTATAPTPTPTAKPTATPAPAVTPAPLVTWNAIVLLYRETDVTFKRSDGSNYRLQARMTNEMYDLVRKVLNQTVKSVSSWSGGMAAMEMKVVDMPHPLTRVDQLGTNLYWVGPGAVAEDLDRYAPTGAYDSVFVIYQPKDAKGVEIPIGGWGLTVPNGPWSNHSGFSSVITPAWLWWWTDSKTPEDVFIHEWMHQVIFFHESQGRIKFDLHAEQQYGYKPADNNWTKDVMQGKVWDGQKYIGMKAEIWAAGKPTAR